MKTLIFSTIILLFMLIGVSFADRMTIRESIPAVYANECGSCHLAYPPRLLSSNEWQKIMANLQNHFKDNASIDNPASLQEITTFLKANSSLSNNGQNNQQLPRITTSPRFKRKHHELAANEFSHPQVKSAANCSACHRRADQWSFSEREIILPSGRRVD